MFEWNIGVMLKVALLLSVADGWRSKERLLQRQLIQNQLMQLNEKRQTVNIRPLQPYSQPYRLMNDEMGVAHAHTRAPNVRTQRTMRPEIRAYIDAFYSQQQVPVMRQEDTTLGILAFNQPFKITEGPTVTLNPNIDAYLDDIFELTKGPKIAPILPTQVLSEGMLWQPYKATTGSKIKAYASGMFPNVQLREQIRMRADDIPIMLRAGKVKHHTTTKQPLADALDPRIIKAIELTGTRGNTENPDGLSDESGFAKIEGAGADRGPNWYDDDTSVAVSDSEIADAGGEGSIDLSSSKNDKSSGASSKETGEKRRATRVYRECTPCPLDMIRKYKNMGIKWICGAYQRARRSFKSICMMRYRNCQDGTMFVKIGDHQCENTTEYNHYHGRSWFYFYKV